ncbi:hypothetical protein [Allorhizocola rhizosphaerae]|uniref:hypothetical protein n=1 Tax=Allorhizocola rhizosphaerae TaxID=1872709 RepID=UPI0013C31ED1|nr:hypothetical protein [Allorhizocola rhizosphaerae]
MSTQPSRPRQRLFARLASIALTVAATVAAVGAIAMPARADNFGGCYGPLTDQGCVPDNFNHWYCYDESVGTINQTFRTQIVAAMVYLHDNTSYDQFFEPNGVCNAASDVVWQVTTAVAPNRGDYACLTFNSAGRCEQARLRLNPNLLTDTHNRRKTACHELGHSVGLAHGQFGASTPEFYDDCMRTGPVNTETRFQQLNLHHRTHANNRA